MSASNGAGPEPAPVVGQTILLHDGTGFLRRWTVVAEKREDGTVWIGIQRA